MYRIVYLFKSYGSSVLGSVARHGTILRVQ